MAAFAGGAFSPAAFDPAAFALNGAPQPSASPRAPYVRGGGPGTNLSLSEYQKKFGAKAAAPAMATPLPGAARRAAAERKKRQQREEEALGLSFHFALFETPTSWEITTP